MNIKTFSLDQQKNKIYDSRTRKYFNEVYKGYTNECYRSATVMLWSVVVCDLIFKLQELEDIYKDKTAGKILSELKKMQDEDPFSPKWEKELIKMVFERTQLLDTASRHKIALIQEHRHFSAHPIISDEDTLFQPTEEMVKSDIRNSIEVLLSKPPFLNQKILTTILTDLEKIKDILPNDKALLKYLDAKYFRSLNKESIIKIFRGLWKFAFRSDEDKAEENREINIRTLNLLYDKQSTAIQESIKNDQSYYSNISSETKIVKHIIKFLSFKKEAYDSLNNAAIQIILPVLHDNISYYSMAFFLEEDPKTHINELIRNINIHSHNIYGKKDNYIEFEQVNVIKGICNEFNLDKEFRLLSIACYSNSVDFARADLYFDWLIIPLIDSFTESDLILLLHDCNLNKQIYTRNKSKVDDLSILLKAKNTLPKGYDFSIYSNLPIERMDIPTD